MHDATATPAGPPSSVVFGRAVDDFLGWHRGNTRLGYEFDVQIFRGWCADQQIEPLAITRLEVEAFLIHCEEKRGNSLRTIQRRMTTLRRLYALMADDGLIPKSPVELARLRRRYRAPEEQDPDLGLDRFELSALLHAGIAARPIDAALVALMGEMGLRVSEACGLAVGDVLHTEQQHRVIRFIGKGGKPALAPIPPQVWRVLEPLTHRPLDEPLLLRPNTGTAMNRVAAARIVKKLALAAGIDRKVHPHMLRAGYVSGMLDAGASIRQAQTGARHSDPRMTAHYDRHRRSLDQHPNYLLAAWISGAA